MKWKDQVTHTHTSQHTACDGFGRNLFFWDRAGEMGLMQCLNIPNCDRVEISHLEKRTEIIYNKIVR